MFNISIPLPELRPADRLDPSSAPRSLTALSLSPVALSCGNDFGLQVTDIRTSSENRDSQTEAAYAQSQFWFGLQSAHSSRRWEKLRVRTWWFTFRNMKRSWPGGKTSQVFSSSLQEICWWTKLDEKTFVQPKNGAAYYCFTSHCPTTEEKSVVDFKNGH